jgi:hypothetical protein
MSLLRLVDCDHLKARLERRKESRMGEIQGQQLHFITTTAGGLSSLGLGTSYTAV